MDNLIYDIIGIDQLHCIQAKINLCEQIMECKLKNKKYEIKRDHGQKFYRYKRVFFSVIRPNINIKYADCESNNNVSNNNITDHQQSALDKLLHKLGDVFSETPSVTNVYEHKSIVQDEPKFVQVPLHFHQCVDHEIHKMHENNIMELSLIHI